MLATRAGSLLAEYVLRTVLHVLTRRCLCYARLPGVFLMASVLAASPISAMAEVSAQIVHIGFLAPGSRAGSAPLLQALLGGLRTFGYEENKNLIIEERYADGAAEGLAPLAADLVERHVEVMVTGSIPAAIAAKNSTSRIPIVVAAAGDLVGNGLVATMEKPGGNITGIDELVPGLAKKRLELLNDAVKLRSSVAILSSASGPTHERQMRETQLAARELGLHLDVFQIKDAREIEPTFVSMTGGRPSGLLVFSGVLTAINGKRIVDLAAQYNLPAMYWYVGFISQGGLMYYGPNVPEMFHQSAALVAQILKGENPADIPVQYATHVEFVVNLRAARALGITVPESILAKATRVVEQ